MLSEQRTETMFGTRILTLSTIALLLVGMAKASKATQYGTVDEAKALLNRVVAALKDNKTKALLDFNTGNDGYKDHDLYVLCANASDGIITASPNSNGMSLNDFPPGQNVMKTATESEVRERQRTGGLALVQSSHSRNIRSIRKSAIKFAVWVIGKDQPRHNKLQRSTNSLEVDPGT